jgi:hypothetical protein
MMMIDSALASAAPQPISTIRLLLACGYLAQYRYHGTHGGLIFGGAFVAMGVLFVCVGVHVYRTFRLLKNTPQVAIGSLTPGFVHIHGKAVGKELLTSPITRLPCFYYGVGVDVWRRGGKGSHWQSILIDTHRVKLNLQDDTGQISIDLHQCELDLFKTFAAEIGPSASKKRTIDPSLGSGPGPSDDELLEYLFQAHSRIHAEQAVNDEGVIRATMHDRSFTTLPAVFPLEIRGQRLRFNEQCLLPDREYNLIGTCVENPNAPEEHDRKMIARGGNWRHYVISCRGEAALEKHEMWMAFVILALGFAMIAGGILLYHFLPANPH